MLEPKLYTSNGMEAVRLLSADGNEFFYEGRVDYNPDQVFKDSQGRAYYLVTTDLGKGMTYYVEVEPKGTPIPMQKKGALPEKDISDLVVSSPRESARLPPNEVFSRPIESKPHETPRTAPVFPADKPVDGFGKPIVPSAGEDAEETIAPPSEEEHEHAVEAMESITSKKKSKKRPILKIALALAAIIIILLAAAGGLYLYKPDWVKSHMPFLATPTPAPTFTPTITTTPAPTITPTPQPTAPIGPDFYNNLYAIGAAIHNTNESVVSFANNHTGTNTGNANTTMTRTLDVFDYVNSKWVSAPTNATPDNASLLVSRLSGNDRDYSIAMAAIAESLGEKARVVEAFDGDNVTYYPEIMVATNSVDNDNVKLYIGSRYGSKDVFGHNDGSQYWLSLAMGKAAGAGVNATYQYAVDSAGGVSPLKS